MLFYFHHVEILRDKQPDNYNRLLQTLDCKPENFLMIGNSVMPVVSIGTYAAYIPLHTA